MATKAEAVNAAADIDEMTFGVEIECALPADRVNALHITVGSYHNGYPLPSGFPREWTAEEDSSLQNFPSNFITMEIVSPVLQGLGGLHQVVAVMEKLSANGMKVNSTCGLHVHVGMRSTLGSQADSFDSVAKWLRHLLNFVSRHELALYAIGGTPDRVSSHYCTSIKSKEEYQRMPRRPTYRFFRDANDEPHGSFHHHGDRYHSLNIASLFKRETVEFRLFAATTNATKVVGYIIVALGICYKAAVGAAVNKFEQTMESGENAPKALARLWTRLDWNRQNHRYGFPTGAVDEFYAAVRKNQNWNAKRFAAIVTTGGTADSSQ